MSSSQSLEHHAVKDLLYISPCNCICAEVAIEFFPSLRGSIV